MVRIAPGTKPWDALMEDVLDGIEGKADAALAALADKLDSDSNLSDLADPAAARTALSVYSKAYIDALETGNGIANITKVGTVGLVDTYEILLDDGSTKNFTVTNGAAGAAGRGITSIALISTVGLIKTYRVTYTDGGTFDYTVANGANGTNGTNGSDGATGATGATGPTSTMHATSTSARDIGTGSKTFALSPSMAVPFQLGMVVRAVSDANSANYMAGYVTAAAVNSVTLNVVETGGAGNLNDWTLNLGGLRGIQGPQGSANIFGPAGSVPGPYPDGTVTYEY